MKKLALIGLFGLVQFAATAQKEIVIQKIVVGPDGKTDTIVQRIDPSEGGIPKIRFERGTADDLPPGAGRRPIIIQKNSDAIDGGPAFDKKNKREREVTVRVNDENGPEKGEIIIQKITVGPDGKADTIIERRQLDGQNGPRKMIFIEENDEKALGEGGPIRIEKRVEKRIGPDGEMRIETFENGDDGEHFGHRPSPNESHFTNEIGLNATNLVAKLVRQGGENISNGSPFVLSYKVFWKNIGLRTAAGWATASAEDAGTPGAGSAITRKTADRDFRAGLEWQFSVARRWRAYVGADFLFGKGSRTVRTFFIDAFGNLQSGDIQKKASRRGLGGAVGVQFMLNRSVGIGCESTGYWLRQTNTQRDDFDPNASATETANTTFSIAPPSALFLYFRF